MSKPEEIPDTLYPEGNVPMPKAPGLTTIPATAPGDLVTELQAIERCARGRGTPACDAIADRLAAMLARIEVGGGEATQPVAWRIAFADGSQSKWRDLPARKLRPVDGRGARIEFAYPPASGAVPEGLRLQIMVAIHELESVEAVNGASDGVSYAKQSLNRALAMLAYDPERLRKELGGP